MWNDAFYTIMFYGLSLVAVLGSLAVVTTHYLLRGAMCLAGVLVVSSGLYLLLGFEFLAGIQILVYVGGIVVLMVFAVMLTSSADMTESSPTVFREWSGMIISLALFVTGVLTFAHTEFPLSSSQNSVENDVVELGKKLLDAGSEGYVLPFEIISLLLLAAMIGGIVVSRKKQQSN
ncbi:MAG: NADH-quinone oxidoreductase subunit J [SAR324 cluster bacterium]|nr:NADH-quinone oxidoreductase subunit J [SAR324 cluster bacterium]